MPFAADDDDLDIFPMIGHRHAREIDGGGRRYFKMSCKRCRYGPMVNALLVDILRCSVGSESGGGYEVGVFGADRQQ